MYSTEVALVFTELPDVPLLKDSSGPYLLSMWDCTSHIAGWHSDGYFHVGQVRLNSRAIRSWAELPSPVDAAAWGADILSAAKRRDGRGFEAPGWLVPHEDVRFGRLPAAAAHVLSEIGPVGATSVSSDVTAWVLRVASEIRSAIGTGQPVCAAWPYRDGGGEYLVAGFWVEGNADPKHCYDVGMAVGGLAEYRFHLDEPSMPDFTEALHCLALLVREVGAKIELCVRDGRPALDFTAAAA